MLALRGVHSHRRGPFGPALGARRTLPEKPTAPRPLRTWMHSIYMLLIFGGLVSAPSSEDKAASHPRLNTALTFLLGATIWVITSVLPLTFMIAMAWGCDTSTRQLGRRALIFCGNDADSAKQQSPPPN